MSMTPEQVREKIRVSAMRFTQEVASIFGEAFTSVAAEFQALPKEPKVTTRTPPSPLRHPPVRAARATTPKAKGSPDKRYRRSMSELEVVAADVVKLLTASQQRMRVEEINRELGTSTRQLMRPIQKLLSQGKIQKAGERRATVYFV